MADRNNFPIGATLAGGAFLIAERLHGERSRGLYRGVSRWDFDQRSVLVTVTTRQQAPIDQLAGALAMEVEGISRLRHVGPVDGEPAGADGHDGLVEDEPPGAPLSTGALPLPLPEVVSLVRQLIELLDRAHRAGVSIGELVPELIYARRSAGGDLQLTGLAPRAPAFARGARLPEYPVGPLFPHSYRAPELLTGGEARPAADIFSLAAVAAALASGRHPFVGDWAGPQMVAIVAGRRRPYSGPPALAALLDRGLAAEPDRRPSLQELALGLAGVAR